MKERSERKRKSERPGLITSTGSPAQGSRCDGLGSTTHSSPLSLKWDRDGRKGTGLQEEACGSLQGGQEVGELGGDEPPHPTLPAPPLQFIRLRTPLSWSCFLLMWCVPSQSPLRATPREGQRSDKQGRGSRRDTVAPVGSIDDGGWWGRGWEQSWKAISPCQVCAQNHKPSPGQRSAKSPGEKPPA